MHDEITGSNHRAVKSLLLADHKAGWSGLRADCLAIGVDQALARMVQAWP
jgi:hypothetical protein